MPAIGAPLRKWTTLLLLCSALPVLAQPTNDNAATASVNNSSAAPPTTSSHTASVAHSTLRSPTTAYPDSTCRSRTINYITHTLPQQCLRTSWSASTETASQAGSEGAGEAVPTSLDRTQSEGASTEEGIKQPEHRVQENSQQTEAASPQYTEAISVESESEAEGEVEADSPLDNANFLSFEEWKNKNLARAGQSPENVGQGRAASSESRNRRRPVNINALDALGEESEIELDFSGFGQVSDGDAGPGGAPSGTQDVVDSTKSSDSGDNVAPTSFALSKDAGKTCKERFNYASFDCAATVLKTNKKAKSSSSVLVENKDSYMLNECSADNKFVIVELCDDILVDTVVLANYEFFSSMFRHFRVSVSDRYPVKMDRWRTLGHFEARNSRDLQPFLVKEPQIWARYLRIEFLTHYGNEFYCPLSLLRVHGTTMMEQFRREEEEARGEDDFAEPIEAGDGEPVETAVAVKDGGGANPTKQVPTEPDKPADVAFDSPKRETDVALPPEVVETDGQHNDSVAQAGSSDTASTSAAEAMPPHNSTTIVEAKTADEQSPAAPTPTPQTQNTSEAGGSETTQINEKDRSEISRPTSNEAAASTQGTAAESKPAAAGGSSNQDSKAASGRSADDSSGVSNGSIASKSPNSTTHSTPSQARASSQTQPNGASPTTQESFFKSIHKRLQQLEANSTLSLQYIEEQSRILRDAFIKVEKRQLAKTEKFLNHLNSTVMQELKSYRSMYDQLWQSTILELEGMKERQRTEVGEIGARLSLVADELVWQKRMAVVQSTLLLLCLGLVLFVRSGTLGNNQSDMPIVQQLGSRYTRFFESPPGSPNPPSGVLRRRRTFRNIWRSDASAGLSERSGHLSDGVNVPSDADLDGLLSPRQNGLQYSPSSPATPRAPVITTPQSTVSASASASASASSSSSRPHQQPNGTPINDENDPNSQRSDLDSSDQDQDQDQDRDHDQAQRIQFLATQSGPATPHGTRDNRPSWEEVDRAVDMLKAEELDLELNLESDERKKKRSPLQRAASYDHAAAAAAAAAGDDVDDSPGDDDSREGLFVA